MLEGIARPFDRFHRFHSTNSCQSRVDHTQYCRRLTSEVNSVFERSERAVYEHLLHLLNHSLCRCHQQESYMTPLRLRSIPIVYSDYEAMWIFHSQKARLLQWFVFAENPRLRFS